MTQGSERGKRCCAKQAQGNECGVNLHGICRDGACRCWCHGRRAA